MAPTYNPLNQLMEFEDAEGNVTTYAYDGTGMRVSKIQGTNVQRFYWDRGYIINESTNGAFTASNSVGIQGIFARTTESGENAQTDFFFKNARGDVTDIVSDDEVTNEYEYDAYGNQKTISANDINPFRYCGEYYDEESGLIYLRNRYYDPEIGRFITEDPYWNVDNMVYGDKEYKVEEIKIPDMNAIMQNSNLYAYCMNNPIRYIDIKGLNAGDFFLTEEEAAKDFANIYNPKSIKDNSEYGAYIYSFIGVKKIGKNAEIRTYYTYGEPTKGTHDSLSTESFSKITYSNATKVAIIHTHGRYDSEYSKENFSGEDISTTRNKGLGRIYLATPGGYLKVCNAESVTVTTIARIPFDKSSPDKAWWRLWGGVSY